MQIYCHSLKLCWRFSSKRRSLCDSFLVLLWGCVDDLWMILKRVKGSTKNYWEGKNFERYLIKVLYMHDNIKVIKTKKIQSFSWLRWIFSKQREISSKVGSFGVLLKKKWREKQIRGKNMVERSLLTSFFIKSLYVLCMLSSLTCEWYMWSTNQFSSCWASFNCGMKWEEFLACYAHSIMILVE